MLMPLHRHVSGIHWTHRLFVCSGLCLFACLLVCQLLCFGFTFGRLSSQGESACFQPFCTTACKFIFFYHAESCSQSTSNVVKPQKITTESQEPWQGPERKQTASCQRASVCALCLAQGCPTKKNNRTLFSQGQGACIPSSITTNHTPSKCRENMLT